MATTTTTTTTSEDQQELEQEQEEEWVEAPGGWYQEDNTIVSTTSSSCSNSRHFPIPTQPTHTRSISLEVSVVYSSIFELLSYCLFSVLVASALRSICFCYLFSSSSPNKSRHDGRCTVLDGRLAIVKARWLVFANPSSAPGDHCGIAHRFSYTCGKESTGSMVRSTILWSGKLVSP